MWFTLFTVLLAEVLWANTEVSWPNGTYGLPRPKSGCPESAGLLWDIGWRKQDMEDSNKGKYTAISHDSQMDATIMFSSSKKDILRHFCIKHESGSLKKDWPNGSYCIYKKGVCPNGMKSGSIRWDDEDSSNNNGRNGILPDGQYDKNTIIYYCCQNEGFWYNAIDLPVDRPFYLLPRNTGLKPECQVVKWAISSLENIIYDTEDGSNGDKFTGSHVFSKAYNGDSAPQMYYCYYYGCHHKLSIESGLINSYFMDDHSQYQYCSWLITVDAGRVVLLHFYNLLIFPNCDESFLTIFDGSNSTASAIATICGENAISDTRVISTTNNMFMVLNAGSYSQNPRSYTEFHSQYYTHQLPEQDFQLTTADNGSLEWFSPGPSPIFHPPKQYTWLVTVSEHSVVLLNFTHLKLPNCNESYVHIYDGKSAESSVIITLCGSVVSPGVLVMSSSNNVFLVLDPRNYLQKPGTVLEFRAKYIAQPKEECHFKYTSNNGSLVWSPPVPTIYGYPNHFSWLVAVNEEFVVVLNVFNNPPEGFLTIYDGGSDRAPILATFYGRKPTTTNSNIFPKSITSHGNSIYISLKIGKYLSNSTTHPSFQAVYSVQPVQETTVIPSTPPPRHAESSKPPVTYIIVPIVVGILIIFIIIIFVIVYRKRKRQEIEVNLVRQGNPSYEMRISTNPNKQPNLNNYAIPISPEEKLWIGNSAICKESRNPIYQPATDDSDENITYNSTDNITYEPSVDAPDPHSSQDNMTYEPVVNERSESQTVLNNTPDVHYYNTPGGGNFPVYAEPTEPTREAHYDVPDMSTD